MEHWSIKECKRGPGYFLPHPLSDKIVQPLAYDLINRKLGVM